MPPIEKYRRGILGDDQHMGVGYLPIAAEPAHLRLDFLPYEERTVQPYGILLDNIFYFADVLRVWVGARENGNGKNKRKFIVRRDPRDISKIWFYDPDLQKYFPIPYRNLSRPVISLWELRAATAMLKKDGKSAEDEDTIFAALEAMWAIERAASTATKQARRNSERGLYHKIASQTLADRQTEKSSSAEHSSDDGWDTSLLKPFEE